MKCWHWTDAQETSPPSKAVVMVAEQDADRLVLAELLDLVTAAEAPTQEIRERAITPRVMGGTLAATLEIKSTGEGEATLPPEVGEMLLACSTALGLGVHELLKRAFCFRFFAW